MLAAPPGREVRFLGGLVEWLQEEELLRMEARIWEESDREGFLEVRNQQKPPL